MKRSIVSAVALAAVLAVAAPQSGYSQNPPQAAPNQPPAAQQQAQPPAPAQPGGGAAGGVEGGPHMGQGMGSMMGRGMGGMMSMMEHGPGMMGHQWRYGGMHRPSAQRCRDRLARRAAMVAYVVTQLDLNPQQQQTWNQVRNALEEGLRREQQLCGVLEPGAQNAPENILDLVNLREQVLQTQLQTLQHARPALQQLYQSLSPRQKDIINRAVGRG